MSSHPDIVFPADVADLDKEVLTRAISARIPGVVVEDFQILTTKYAGEGVASTADRVVLELVYAAGAPSDLPTRLILKTMLVGPHAPPEMYETEVRFYGEIQPEIQMETPLSFGAQFSGEAGNFGILMEDLERRGARFPKATETVSLGEVKSLLGQLARLHAHFWRSNRFATDLQWIPTPLAGGMQTIFTNFGYEFVQSQVDMHPFKQELIAPLGRSVRELWDSLTIVRDEQASLPATVLHGDTHIGNTYLLPDERGGFLDWQLMTRGCFAADITYLMVTALPTEVRRQHQTDLVRFYLDALRENGADPVPSFDEAWLLCRKASLWGLVIGWLICPPANYGEEVTAKNIERTATAVADLDALAAIG